MKREREREGKKKKRQTCNQPGRFRLLCYSVAFICFVPTCSTSTKYEARDGTSSKEFDIRLLDMMLDFPTNIDAPLWLIFIRRVRCKRVIKVSLKCLIILIYYFVVRCLSLSLCKHANAMSREWVRKDLLNDGSDCAISPRSPF